MKRYTQFAGDVDPYTYGGWWKSNDPDYIDILMTYGLEAEDIANEDTVTVYEFALDDPAKEEWVDCKGICSFIGIPLDEWLSLEPEDRLVDAVSYYGTEEFGDSEGVRLTIEELRQRVEADI